MKDTSEVRIPRQQRSIEKKARIIKAGGELFIEKGYFATTTVDIAKRAGVSTGIVYNYFKDKEDILYELFNEFADNILDPVINIVRQLTPGINYLPVLDMLFDSLVKAHENLSVLHNELDTITSSSERFNHLICTFYKRINDEICTVFIEQGFNITNISEKVSIVINLIENYAHNLVFHKHDYYNYDVLRKETQDIIIYILNQNN